MSTYMGKKKQESSKDLLILYIVIFLVAVITPAFCWSQVANVGNVHVMRETQFSSISDFHNNGEFINDGQVLFYDDFLNDGIFDYVLGGNTLFQGSAVQSLKGEASMYFYDVVFDNANTGRAFVLEGNSVSIAGEASFEQGVLQITGDDAQVVFEKDAFHSGVNTGSYVEGPVLKYGDSSFEFPIGEGGNFKPLSIGAPNDENDVYMAQYFFENPDNIYPITQKENNISVIDGNGYWVVRSSVESEVMSIVLSWDNSSTSGEILALPLERISVVRWDVDKDMWVNEGGVVDVANETVTINTAIKMDNVFTLGHGGQDSDGDGLPDNLDPNDSNPDTDGDGIPDGADVDVDGDGVNDNGTDSDGDGINDASDVDTNGEPDNDGDGIADDNDPVDNTLDSDGDGLPDDLDPDDSNPDTDGDGIPDGVDVDVDGDGIEDNGTDSDGDGLIDAIDIEDNLATSTVFNFLSPNADGLNDFFEIDNIDKTLNNSVDIYNVNAIKVFTAKDYGENGNVFRGESNVGGLLSVGNGNALPTGTYFYFLSYDDANGSRVRRSGFIYLITE